MTKDALRTFINKMMESLAIDKETGEVKVIDEAANKEAEEILNRMIVESASARWAKLEAAENDLADMSDEISFDELNADSSHVVSPALDVDVEDAGVPTLESVLGEGDEFDLKSIFEMGDHDFMMDDEGDEEVVDGDDEFDDLMRGDDEDGLGDEGPVGDDLDMDADDDMDAIGSEDDMGDDMDMDPEMGDDLDDGMEGDDFDFSFLDDEGGEFGDDEFGGDDMGDDMGGEEEFADEMAGVVR